MVLDDALGDPKAFNALYAYCKKESAKWPNGGLKWELVAEFLELVRVLNPLQGRHARDFFPFYVFTSGRASYIYSVLGPQVLSQDVLIPIEQKYRAGELDDHAFDIAYVRQYGFLDWHIWFPFANSAEGKVIGAELLSPAENQVDFIPLLKKVDQMALDDPMRIDLEKRYGPFGNSHAKPKVVSASSAAAPASAVRGVGIQPGAFRDKPAGIVLTPASAQSYLRQQTQANLSSAAPAVALKTPAVEIVPQRRLPPPLPPMPASRIKPQSAAPQRPPSAAVSLMSAIQTTARHRPDNPDSRIYRQQGKAQPRKLPPLPKCPPHVTVASK